MGSTMVWLFLLSLELGLASVEYIVNGNFEYPVLDPNGTSFSAGGWNGSNFNMVNRFEFGASYGQYIDVQNILGYTGQLSQTVSLPLSGQYILKFVMKYIGDQNDHTLQVFLNTKSVVDFSCTANRQTSFSIEVQGSVGLNQVRFVQEGNQDIKGYYIDNVSLTGPQIYHFNCLKQIDFLKVQALLQCQNSDHFSPLQAIFENINISINNQTIDYNVVSYQKQTITIQLLPQNQDLVLNQINISVPSSVMNQLGQPSSLLLFLVEDLQLSLVRIKSMYDSQFIVHIYSISSVLMEKIKQLYSIFSTCVASYFLVSIISFWNLALMFNTVNISTMPPFAKAFLQKLAFIFFNLSSISEWIGIDMQTLNGLADLNQIGGRQLMELKRGQNIWFGSFGISSKFFANNIESIFVICCSLMKFLMLFWLRKIKCIPDRFRKKLPIAKVVWKLFLLQSISAQTFIVLSSITTILNSGFVDIKEKANFMIQSVVIFISFAVLYFYFFIAVEIRLRSYKQKSQNQLDSKADIIKQHLNRKQIAMKSYLTELNAVLEFLPMIIVPFFIVFDSPIAILSVTLSFFILRFVWLIRKASFLSLSIVEKVFTFINVVLFTLLCLIYFSLYVVQHIKSWPHPQIQGLELRIKQYCDTCGLLIIFVTLGGGIMQIEKHSILFVVFIVKRFQKLIQIIRKGKKQRTNKVTFVIKAKKRTTANDAKLKTKGTQSKKDIVKIATFSKTFVITNKRTNENTTNKQKMMKIKNGDREVSRNKEGIVFLQNN